MAHRQMAGHLTCPKCGGAMEQYDRNHVIIDQCERCGGIFLDRGELERLVEGEAGYYGGHGGPSQGGGFLGGIFGGGQHGGRRGGHH